MINLQGISYPAKYRGILIDDCDRFAVFEISSFEVYLRNLFGSVAGGWTGETIEIYFDNGAIYQCDLSAMGLLRHQEKYAIPRDKCKSFCAQKNCYCNNCFLPPPDVPN